MPAFASAVARDQCDKKKKSVGNLRFRKMASAARKRERSTHTRTRAFTRALGSSQSLAAYRAHGQKNRSGLCQSRHRAAIPWRASSRRALSSRWEICLAIHISCRLGADRPSTRNPDKPTSGVLQPTMQGDGENKIKSEMHDIVRQ